MNHRTFPITQWTKIWSTKPLEWLNAEIKRRPNVVGIFPGDAAVSRLVTVVLVEQHDEWRSPSVATSPKR